jgi:hypothetical protein
VSECGSHGGLMPLAGTYARMFRLQADAFLDTAAGSRPPAEGDQAEDTRTPQYQLLR